MGRNKKSTTNVFPWKEVLGLFGVVLAAYISYLGIRSQIEIPIKATQTAEARLADSTSDFTQAPTEIDTPTLIIDTSSVPQLTATSLSAQAQPPSSSSSPIPTTSIPSLSGGDANCLQQYFADIDPARQISIEVGDRARDYVLLSQDSFDQNFIGPFGISLTHNGRMIGALSFLFFTDSYLFKITSVVDSNCQVVTEYSNAIRGGDKNAIQNSETLKIQLAESIFFLNFQFSHTNFFRFNFQQLQ